MSFVPPFRTPKNLGGSYSSHAMAPRDGRRYRSRTVTALLCGTWRAIRGSSGSAIHLDPRKVDEHRRLYTLDPKPREGSIDGGAPCLAGDILLLGRVSGRGLRSITFRGLKVGVWTISAVNPTYRARRGRTVL